MNDYFVYILYSSSRDRFYVGCTSDNLDDRLRRHNTNHDGFTGKALDWALVYYEHFSDKSAALKREREIKAWKSRKRIKSLIDGFKEIG